MNVEQNSEVSTPWLVFSSMTGVCQFLVDFHRCCQNPSKKPAKKPAAKKPAAKKAAKKPAKKPAAKKTAKK